MTRTSKALKRLGVGGLAAVTVGAGLPVLFATSASAAPPTSITITPVNRASGATGTCVPFRVTLSNASGGAVDPTNVQIVLTDPSATGTAATATDDQTAQFCDLTGGSATATSFGSPAGGTQSDASNRRRITRVGVTNNVVFGVVNSQEETVALRAFTGDTATFDPNTGVSTTASVVFTPGSGTNTQPANSQTSSDNTRTITEVAQPASEDTTVAGGTQTIRVRTLNASGDPVAGVLPRFIVQAGGANSVGTANNPGVTTDPAPVQNCAVSSDNTGIATCTVPVANAGTDNILVFVQQTAGGSPRNDPSEPQITVRRTTAAQPAPAAEARFISIQPKQATTPSGSTRTFVASVTSAAGRPVVGVVVTFTEDGPGRFVASPNVSGGATNVGGTFQGTTNNAGQASVVTTAVAGETGTQVITATIPNTGNQTGQAAGQGLNATATTPAGNSQDATTNVFGAPTSSPTTTATPTATSTATASPSPTGACSVRPLVTVSPSTIGAGASASVTGRATPNSRIQLVAYSRPSTTFRVARDTVVSASGNFAFTVALGTNTRLYVQEVGCPSNANNSRVIAVRTVLSFFATRNGVRRYTFTGQVLPRRSGQLVSLYRRTTRGDVLTSQVRTTANGSFTFGRQFTGNGRFDFFVRTGANLTNVAGVSNVRALTVF